MNFYSRLLLCLSLSSCQKVITLPLKTASPELDIQGNVTNVPSPYTVSLTRSVDFYASNVYPTVSGAIVKIGDSTLGITDSLTETSPGMYNTHVIQGIPGHTYTLYVRTGEQVFRATSTMPAPVPLDSVTFSVNNRGGKSIIQPIPNFQDPPGVHNYYQFVVYVNGTQLQKTFAFDDRLSDGRYIHRPLDTDTGQVKAGDQVLVEMFSIESPLYTYFSEVQQITDPGSQSQDVSPANPQSNITGGSLGYFSAHTVSPASAVAP